MAVGNPERYANAEDLSSIFTKIETKLQNRYTKAATDTAISNAIAGVTQFDYQVVDSLPASGTKGIIYLVPNSGSSPNIYDEYIWIVVEESGQPVGHFEKIGYREIDVSGKLENADVKVTSGQITKTNDPSGNGFTLGLDSTITSDLAEKLENADVKVNSTRLSKTNDQSGNGFTVDLSSSVQTSLGKADTALQSTNIDGQTVKWDTTNSQLYVGIDGTTIVKDSTTGALKISDDYQLDVDHFTTEQINTLKAIFTDDPVSNSNP